MLGAKLCGGVVGPRAGRRELGRSPGSAGPGFLSLSAKGSSLPLWRVTGLRTPPAGR